jgi:hypothetical protein
VANCDPPIGDYFPKSRNVFSEKQGMNANFSNARAFRLMEHSGVTR